MPISGTQTPIQASVSDTQTPALPHTQLSDGMPMQHPNPDKIPVR